jgi:predicted dehydrogenase
MLGDSPGRREFFRLAGAAAFTTSLLKAAHGKVRVGFIGVGSAGSANMACAARVPGCEIAALCDLDRTALDRAAALGRKLGFGGVRASRNFRCVLADKAIDAVCISAP